MSLIFDLKFFLRVLVHLLKVLNKIRQYCLIIFLNHKAIRQYSREKDLVNQGLDARVYEIY